MTVFSSPRGEHAGTVGRHTADSITSDALDDLYARIETLEHVAAGNKRHVQLIVPDLERAEAVITRVRAVACDPDTYDDPADVIKAVRAALDEPRPQPDGVLADLEAQEKTIHEHTLSLHLIGEQLSTIESWFWNHLADVRETARKQIGGPLPDDATAAEPDTPSELTAEEASSLADDLGRDLYKAQDALAFVEECCVIAEREGRTITVADVRTWLKGARCGRQLTADERSTGQRWMDALLHRGPGYDVTWSGPPIPRFTYRPVTPEMERAATERARQCAEDSERAAAWFAATGGVIGTPAATEATGLREQYEAILGRALVGAGISPRHLLDELLTVRDARLEQLTKERDMLGRETDRLRRDWTSVRDRAETAEQQRDQLAGALDQIRALAVEYPVAVPTNLIDEALDQPPQHDGEHIYLSTGCRHDDHDYCNNMTGLAGTKRPAECKHCGATCICPCHTTTKGN